MSLTATQITTACAVLGSVGAMGRLTYKVGQLVTRVEVLIDQKAKDHAALDGRITTVATAMDRHEQWHIDNSPKGRHKR